MSETRIRTWKNSPLQKLWWWLWLSDPTWSEERKAREQLVRRLDFFFCSYTSLSAIVKLLDQTNISNAYVSGMKEDLSLFGNQLNFFTTYFNIGYIVMIPISAYFINGRIRPSIFLPTAELFWGIGTAGLAAAKNYKQVYGLRFFVGFCEGTAWPGTMTLILSWYTPGEIGKRMAVYNGATTLGGIFSGALQSALYTNLNGSHGIAGWRWLFIVNACITVFVAIWGYVGCPDYPNKVNPLAKKYWLREQDEVTAVARMKSVRREMPKGWSLATFKSVVTRPQNITVLLAYEFIGQGGTGTGFFNLWLKSLKKANGKSRFTVSQLNTIPIAGSVINILSLFFFLSLSDVFKTRWPFVIIVALNGIIWASVLTAWYVPDGAKMAAFLLLNICSVYANLIVSWLGDLVRHSAEERSLIVAAFPVIFYTLGAGVPLKVFPASQAPHYKIGWKYPVIMFSIGIPFTLLTVYLERRQNRIDALNQIPDESDHNSISAPQSEKDDEKYGVVAPTGAELAARNLPTL
ncbi:hypothetical protein M231_06684 [Tremella mesenterica]|uniref:Major facilitator superfamily (MFS) profile domain-containing protein n=1 Tax=Tremella mesenterica TaxID=5217 RepID=A0A4Q1BDH7_TREME|nr:hypothetical protein M231_06684 [Tremella mesenterica]